MTSLDSILKSRDITLPTNVHLAKSYGFSSCHHVWIWELDNKKGWTPKNWCLRTVVLEKTLESPVDSKGIKPVSLKGNQPWIFIGRIDAEAEAPLLWPPGGKSRVFGRDLDAEKDWRQEEKGTTEDEMVGWHHWLNGHEPEQTLREPAWVLLHLRLALALDWTPPECCEASILILVCHEETCRLTFYKSDLGETLLDLKSCSGSHGTLLTQTSRFCVCVWLVCSTLYCFVCDQSNRQKSNCALDFRFACPNPQGSK